MSRILGPLPPPLSVIVDGVTWVPERTSPRMQAAVATALVLRAALARAFAQATEQVTRT